MNWDAIGAIGELVGALVVFLTLIYLATQIRIQNQQLQLQNRETRLAGNQELFKSITEHTQAINSDPELIEIYYQSFTKNFSEFDTKSALRLSFIYQNQVKIWENAYYKHLDNQFDERMWPSLERSMSLMTTSTAFKQWWPTRARVFSDDFVKYVNEMANLEIQEGPLKLITDD